jgi:hypothetical protein
MRTTPFRIVTVPVASEHQVPGSTEPKQAEEPSFGDGTGIALGLSFGVLAGLTLLDDLGLGLGLGLAFGAAFDVLAGRRRR